MIRIVSLLVFAFLAGVCAKCLLYGHASFILYLPFAWMAYEGIHGKKDGTRKSL